MFMLMGIINSYMTRKPDRVPSMGEKNLTGKMCGWITIDRKHSFFAIRCRIACLAGVDTYAKHA